MNINCFILICKNLISNEPYAPLFRAAIAQPPNGSERAILGKIKNLNFLKFSNLSKLNFEFRTVINILVKKIMDIFCVLCMLVVMEFPIFSSIFSAPILQDCMLRHITGLQYLNNVNPRNLRSYRFLQRHSFTRVFASASQVSTSHTQTRQRVIPFVTAIILSNIDPVWPTRWQSTIRLPRVRSNIWHFSHCACAIYRRNARHAKSWKTGQLVCI